MLQHYQPKEVHCVVNRETMKPRIVQWVARCLLSATGHTTLGQEGAIIFCRTNIDLPGSQAQSSRINGRVCRPLSPRMTILREATAYDAETLGHDVA